MYNQSHDAENAVLGSLIKTGKITKSNIDVITELHTEAFTLNNNRIVCEAIKHLAKNNLDFDLINLSEYCKSYEFGNDDPFSYCAQLAGNTPSIVNLGNYWEVLKNKYLIRNIEAKINESADILQKQGNDKEKINNALTALSSVKIESDANTFKNASELSISFVEGLQKRLEQGGELAGLSFGFDALDKMTCGAEEGDYIGICAKPSGGKTVSAMEIILRAVMRDESALVFSAEMSEDQLMQRVFANMSTVPLSRIRKPKELEDHDWAKISESASILKNKKLTIVDGSLPHINDIENLTKAYTLKHGKPDWILIDYWELIKSEGQNKVTQMEDISRRLKALAKTIETRVILLAQLKKDAIGRPNASQIKWSAALEQDTDVLIFIHTDNEEYKPRPTDITEWVAYKVRQGQTGIMPTNTQMKYQRFIEFTGDYSPQETKEKGRFQ